ncbi:MAG: polysaccharide deacetylase family protein [Hyphomicrobium sp.]
MLAVAGMAYAGAAMTHAQVRTQDETNRAETASPGTLEPDSKSDSKSGPNSGAENDTSNPALQTAAPEPGVSVPACASDPKRLGLERIVEIDTSGGPVFGGSHSGFLKDHEVILTFDDGPLRPYTRPVLKALAEHCTRATFFMVGRMAAADPRLVKDVLAGGHTIGSHTFSHQNLKPLGFLKGRQDFELGLSAVNKASGGGASPFFRFPYLSESRQVQAHIKKRGMATFFIDIDSKDFQTRDSDEVYKRVMAQLTSLRKGIILMHDIQPSTAGMIKRLLDTLHDKGFKVVHVVAKAKAATLAEFDAPAARILAAKDATSKEKPLADRGLVWTMAKPEPDAEGRAATKPAASALAEPVKTGSVPSPNDARAGAKTGKLTGTQSAPETAAVAPEVLPWSQPAAPEVAKVPDAAAAPSAKPRGAAAPAAKKQVRRPAQELPWQASIFSN